MRLRDLGHTGIRVSEIGVGTWSIVTDWWGNPERAEEIIRTALDVGVNFFDTADMYGNGRSEEILGRVVTPKRGDVVILTKVGYDFYTDSKRPKHRFDLDYLRFAVNQSLKRLNTDYVDVLMIHNPKMKDISNEGLLEFMKSLKSDGIARSVGVALGPTLGWEEEGMRAIQMGYEVLEHIFNLIEEYPGKKLIQRDLGHVIRVPHASDVLNEDKWPLVEDPRLHRHFKDFGWIKRAYEATLDLKKYADSLGIKLNQLAIAYVLSFNNVSTVTPNITSKSELLNFVRASELSLSKEVLSYLEDYYERRYRGLNMESIEETKAYK